MTEEQSLKGTVFMYPDVRDMEKKELVSQEIENFIIYWTTDEKERKEMKETLGDFLNEVFKE